MNLVGKVFTVAILVMSLVFMAFAVGVYSAHRNWRDHVTNPETGLAVQKKKLEDRNKELIEKSDALLAQLATEKSVKEQTVAKLENAKAALEAERDQYQQQLAAKVQQLEAAVGATTAAHMTLASLRQEVMGEDGNSGLRQALRDAQKAQDVSFDKMLASTSEAQQLQNELKRFKQLQVSLASDLAKAKEVLSLHNLKPNPELYASIAPPVPGRVNAVLGSGLIEISIGSDDGLVKGHKLEVYRLTGKQSTYLGRVMVMKTASNKAVCKIDPSFQKGAIQQNDLVASKLN